jgi:hypothetical protein
VFANSSEDDAIYPLTVPEIADAQKDDNTLTKLHKKDNNSYELIDSVKVLRKDGELVIPKNHQNCAVAWYHHNLQHPGTTSLEENLCSAMYWKGMRRSVRAHDVKSATNARSTSAVNISTVNYPQSLLSPNPGILYVLILLVHTLSREKTVL